jgi:hypothetical protein
MVLELAQCVLLPHAHIPLSQPVATLVITVNVVKKQIDGTSSLPRLMTEATRPGTWTDHPVPPRLPTGCWPRIGSFPSFRVSQVPLDPNSHASDVAA